ncbi:MAG: hypothetical protein L0Y71_06205 [Gemmataceae bacterium]|nr:hypothetical protein [Gemmataceae bacterium]
MIAAAPPAPPPMATPIAKPVSKPVPKPVVAKPVASIPQDPPAPAPMARPTPPKLGSHPAIYIVGGLTALTMAIGVSLAVFYGPWRAQPAPEPQPPDKNTLAKAGDKSGPGKQQPIDEPEEPEPGDEVKELFEDCVVTRTVGEPYLEGEQVRVRMDFECVDPRGSIKELKVVVWTGDVAAPKPVSWRKPARRRGDGPRTDVPVTYKDGRGSVEVPLPPLPKDHMYWLQPVLVNAPGKAQWLEVAPWEPLAPPLERRPALLAHRLDGPMRKAQLSSQASVTVSDDTYDFGLHADLEETVKPDGNGAALHVRWTRVRFEFATNGIPAIVEKVLGEALDATAKTPSTWRLDPAGTVGKHTVDLGDLEPTVRKDAAELLGRLADGFDLASLQLPNRELQPLESWTQQRTWNKATLDLTAVYEGRRFHEKREEAHLKLHGTLQGADKDNVGTVEGTALVDLKNGFVMKAELKIETNLIVPFVAPGGLPGQGVLEVRLTRDPAK